MKAKKSYSIDEDVVEQIAKIASHYDRSDSYIVNKALIDYCVAEEIRIAQSQSLDTCSNQSTNHK